MREVMRLMREAGYAPGHPDWNEQFNLTHASIDPELGVRHGLSARIAATIREQYEWCHGRWVRKNAEA